MFILPAIIVVILAILALTSVYTVNDKQQAVVTTFGKVTSIEDPGIHIKLPFGIQEATLVNVNELQSIEIGFRTGNNNDDMTVIESESKMISGDYNIVNCDFFVEYKISDPVKYLYSSEDPADILKSLVQSHIRNVISSYDVDTILTTGKSEIQAKIKEGIQNELAVYDLGLVLTDLKLQDSEPPTVEVQEAFKEVETAKQDKDTAINVALAYQNSELPLAQAEADKLIQNAEYLKQDRINQANIQVAMFNAMYDQYKLNPDITKKRMFYEALEKVLPEAKVYIDTSEDGSTQKLLPIESFVTEEAAQ
ncbi:MAG: FtsH protease activity modulator HflK [Clostridiales bacterium]|nr:MAG: FtsH protease activity modulator HflK [Clostridiales bacterium]